MMMMMTISIVIPLAHWWQDQASILTRQAFLASLTEAVPCPPLCPRSQGRSENEADRPPHPTYPLLPLYCVFVCVCLIYYPSSAIVPGLLIQKPLPNLVGTWTFIGTFRFHFHLIEFHSIPFQDYSGLFLTFRIWDLGFIPHWLGQWDDIGLALVIIVIIIGWQLLLLYLAQTDRDSVWTWPLFIPPSLPQWPIAQPLTDRRTDPAFPTPYTPPCPHPQPTIDMTLPPLPHGPDSGIHLSSHWAELWWW